MLFSSDAAAQKRIEDAAQASALRDYLGRLERPRPLMVAVPLRENGRPQFDADALTALGVDVATVVTPLALQRLSERLPHAFALRPGDVRLFSSTGRWAIPSWRVPAVAVTRSAQRSGRVRWFGMDIRELLLETLIAKVR